MCGLAWLSPKKNKKSKEIAEGKQHCRCHGYLVVVKDRDELDFHFLKLLLCYAFDGVVLVQDSDLGPLAVDEGQLGGLSCDLSHTDVPGN